MLMQLLHRLTAGNPALADSQRAALLMAANAPFDAEIKSVVQRVPFARATIRGLGASLDAATSAGPMVLGEQVLGPRPDPAAGATSSLKRVPVTTLAPSASELVEALDPNLASGVTPLDPAERRARRRAAAAGSLSAVAAGVLAQRVLNHSQHRSAPLADVGRTLSSHLAIGGAAGLIVLATEEGLGPRGRDVLGNPMAAVVLGGMLASLQSKTLRRVAGVLTLPDSPYLTQRPD